MRFIQFVAGLGLALALTACGGGGGLGGAVAPTTAASGAVTITALPTMGIELSTGTNSISPTGSTTALATVKDGTGSAVVGQSVTFSSADNLVKFNPASGQVTTDSRGIASIQVLPLSSTSAGTGTVVAAATVGTTVLSKSLGYELLAFGIQLAAGGTSIAADGSSTAQITLKDGSGQPVPGKLVKFTGDAALIKFSPASGIVLTNNSGIASVSVSPASLTAAGAGTLVAQATVGTAALSTSMDYQMSAANLGLLPINVGVGSLAAFGNRPVSVVATVNGVASINTPVQVTFTASCGTISPATVNTDATGTASTTYSADLAICAGTNVNVTASTVGAPSVSGTVAVNNSIATNVQFVNSTPQLIYLSGTTGATQSQVEFKVVDSTGSPQRNQMLRLALSNTATGVHLDTITNNAAVDKPTNDVGLVSVAVFSGTVPTSLNVSATLLDAANAPTAVVANSNTLTVASGQPTQRSLSLSLTKTSIEGASTDKVSTNVTLSMADRQGNPVPPGTQVNFVAETGVVLPASCVVPATTPPSSSCTVSFSSSGTRTATGRVSILAYVPGEEDFVDINGNNIFDGMDTFTDLGRAYRDDHAQSATGANGTYDNGEFQVPRIGTPACTAPVCGGDSVWGPADVRAQATVVFATSKANITSPSSLVASTPVTGSTDLTLSSVTWVIADKNGNSMPTGTKVDFSAADDGFSLQGYLTSVCTLNSPASFVVSNSLIPASFTTYWKSCTSSDIVTVTVTSPLGTVTQGSITQGILTVQ